jgi:hypothetical protein
MKSAVRTMFVEISRSRTEAARKFNQGGGHEKRK